MINSGTGNEVMGLLSEATAFYQAQVYLTRAGEYRNLLNTPLLPA